ncbi:putative necrosis-inducing factor-domain-containing protein [Podospora didyma]|uniref:Necrosis-inducing factor-domain-containing protein n=1 Tax=Podospora didyma TaxID=330526 RepID=A0AAE0NC31_9PEZI|nr:putative necrosis-inducing factor-domain-containing protein [Podospora didyma]
MFFSTAAVTLLATMALALPTPIDFDIPDVITVPFTDISVDVPDKISVGPDLPDKIPGTDIDIPQFSVTDLLRLTGLPSSLSKTAIASKPNAGALKKLPKVPLIPGLAQATTLFHIASLIASAVQKSGPLFKNSCGTSTVVNQSSAASPLVADCQTLRENLSGAGAFAVVASQRTIAKFGTCAFGADPGKLGATLVGTEDVRDLVADAINKFASQGKVGAKGTMDCGPIGSSVEWGLFHT